jgi:hypothetical protein
MEKETIAAAATTQRKWFIARFTWKPVQLLAMSMYANKESVLTDVYAVIDEQQQQLLVYKAPMPMANAYYHQDILLVSG